MSKLSKQEKKEAKKEKKLNKNVHGTYDSYFDGKMLGLLGRSLLAVFLSAITLGIWMPWAQCMLIRWKISHTVINGKRLVFRGKGGSLFVKNLKWFFLTLITLGIYGLWVPIRVNQWRDSLTFFDDGDVFTNEEFAGRGYNAVPFSNEDDENAVEYEDEDAPKVAPVFTTPVYEENDGLELPEEEAENAGKNE